MQLAGNRRGVSSEAFKIATAMTLALVLFAMFASFAAGPKEADEHFAEAGEHLLEQTQNASLEILSYNDSG